MNLFFSTFFNWLLRASWQASVITAVILAVQWIFHKHLSARWRHALWFLVLARLALPCSLPSPASLFNYMRVDAATGEPVAKNFTPRLFAQSAAARPITGGANIPNIDTSLDFHGQQLT